MKVWARLIVKHRKAVLVIAIILLIPSVLGMLGTRVNYDILSYLPEDLDSMVGQQILDQDFKTASTAMVTLENMPTAETLKLKEALEGIEGVDQVIWTSDLVDVSVPKEMLPEDIQKFFYNEDGATMLLVKFTGSSASASTMNALAQMKATVQEHCFIGGMSAIMADTKQLVNSEMPLYILCAVGFSLLILFLSMKSNSGSAHLHRRHIFSHCLQFRDQYLFGTDFLHYAGSGDSAAAGRHDGF